MKNGFSLYEVELQSVNADNLLKLSTEFSGFAEVDHFDRKSGVLRIGFVSTLSESGVIDLCDEFKKQVESVGGSRLTYKVKVTGL